MAVSEALHDKVLKRDRMCFYRRPEVQGVSHVCHDQWGAPHSSYDLSKLTVDHVHMVSGGIRGKRAPDDIRNLVAMCARENIGGPSREVREAERSYLRGLYGH